jgi:hypothetical protein
LQDDIDRDLVSALASIGREARLLVIIEDIDRSSRKLVNLVDTIVGQLPEFELQIVMTSRPGGLPAKLTNRWSSLLEEDIHALALGLLSPEESQVLSSFFAIDQEYRSHAERRAGGNPSFLEDYCRIPQLSDVPKRVRQTLSKMISKLPKRMRYAAEIVSLFEEPVGWSVLRSRGIAEADLRVHRPAEPSRWCNGLSFSIRYQVKCCCIENPQRQAHGTTRKVLSILEGIGK